MKKPHKKAQPRQKDEAFTRADFARLAGIVLVLGAFLMLTFTPQLVFQSWHRDGYTRTEAEILSGPGRSKSLRVRIASTGEELLVRRSSVDTSIQHARAPVWYNPAARVVMGITLFDTRVISAEWNPELPDFTQAIFAVLLNVILAAAGTYLVFWTPARWQR